MRLIILVLSLNLIALMLLSVNHAVHNVETVIDIC